jgi:hypothetical protein
MIRTLLISAWVCLAALPGIGEAQSARGAFWRSLLVPGWGQRYAGRTTSATRFLTAELGLWGGYFALHRLEEVRQDNYQAQAAEHARARPQGKDGRFFDDLGFYESALQHNLFARYEDGPDAELYAEGPEFFWEWDREESRLRYRELRNASEWAGRQALYATGLVVVNHLLAAIHAARSVGGERKAGVLDESPQRAGAWTGFDPGTGQVRVGLVRRF